MEKLGLWIGDFSKNKIMSLKEQLTSKEINLPAKDIASILEDPKIILIHALVLSQSDKSGEKILLFKVTPYQEDSTVMTLQFSMTATLWKLSFKE